MGGSCRTRAFLAELKEAAFTLGDDSGCVTRNAAPGCGGVSRGRGAHGLCQEQPWTSVIDEEEPQLGEFESRVLPLRSVQESPGMDRSRTESRQASKGESDLAGRMVSPSTPQRALRTDTLSVAGSYCPSMAPSIAPSPHPMAAMLRQDSLMPGGSLNFSTFHSYGDTDKDRLSVRILNGVSGEEEIRFSAPLQADSEQQFLAALDRLCLQHAGQPLAGLNWLSREGEADRFQRRTCDVRMIEELFDQWTRAKDTAKGAVVLLCTIPVQPPSELPRGKVRLKGVEPMRVSCVPQVLRLDTSALEAYSVAFTHQWSNMTYSAEAKVLPSNKGVETSVPWQMLSVSSNEGLYDVHLVIDSTSRSENRRTLTVGSSESEVDSSAKSESTSSFVPIARSETFAQDARNESEPGQAKAS
ncbi:unnamed protein product [Effrenium voratum]|nr:unnamed protein product [Effrenium voratum]